MIIQIYSEAKYLKQSNMHGIYKTDKFGFYHNHFPLQMI